MSRLDRLRRAATPRRLFLLAGAFAAFGILLEATGGFSVRVLGVRISAHNAFRPLLIAILCAAAGFRALDDDGQEQLLRRGAAIGGRFLWLVPVAAAAIVCWLGITRGVRAAGGSDSYGYISQSRLWLNGDLHITQPFVASMPWPDADWTFTPLGYRPVADHTLLPTYAPGLPILMAVFTLVVGACGPYLVGPVCGALLVALTYDLGRRLSGPLVGAIATLTVATSPIVLLMTLSAMSDVPVAAFWTLSIALACRRTAFGAVSAGVAAGIALLIRPNLVPLAFGPAVIAAWPLTGRRAAALGRLVLYGVGCAPFALFVGWLFNRLYGSPLRSGYGDPGFASAHVGANLASYPTWLLETQGPLVFLFLLSALLPGRPSDGAPPLRRLLLLFVAGVFGCYLWYLPFDGWPYLRFMIPALPAVAALAADAVWTLARRAGARVQAVAALAFCLIMIGYGTARARDLAVFAIADIEQKYADVGQYIDRHVPKNAVILAMQHSGSVRHYSGRLTLRYDQMNSEWLDRGLAHLVAAGYEPWLALEDWEVPRFRERFAGQSGAALVDRQPVAIAAGGKVRLYRGGHDPAPEAATADMPRAAGCR